MSTPLRVSVKACAAALGLYVLNFVIPGGAANKNWEKVRAAMKTLGEGAITTLPFIAALIIPRARPVPFAMAAVGMYAMGIGIRAIADDSKTDKVTVATDDLGEGMQKLGVACGIGALVAYMKTQRVD